MKLRTRAMVLFVSVVLILYVVVNGLIYVATNHWLDLWPGLKTGYSVAFGMLVVAYPLARMLDFLKLKKIARPLIWIGSFWLGAMLYLVLALVANQLLNLSSHYAFFIPGYQKLIGVYVITLLLLVIGFINSICPVVKEFDIMIPKKGGGEDDIRLVFISDIHLGYIVGKRRLCKLVDRVNTMKPDLIVLGGDIVDEDLQPVIDQDMGALLRELRAPLGVFGVTGNHEFIGGVDSAVRYLEANGIRMVRDTALVVADRLVLIGRDDVEGRRFSGNLRVPVKKLFNGVDLNYPVIMIDHRPVELEKYSAAGVDLSLHGHTHHGQLWPFHLITRMLYRVSYGYQRINNMQTYVSSGVGGWGPPVRLGNRPEVVVINLHFS